MKMRSNVGKKRIRAGTNLQLKMENQILMQKHY